MAATLARKYNVTPPTAAADIQKLKKKGILQRVTTRGRANYFFAPQIAAVVFAD
jgi:Fic family protein